MLTKYDADRAPDPGRWLAEDDQWKQEIVIRYHRRIGLRFERELLHATAHVVVENQLALGDAYPVAGVLERLRGEGLSRHDAIHAIASVLMRHLIDAMNDPEGTQDLGEAYMEDVKTMTKQRWYDENAPEAELEP